MSRIIVDTGPCLNFLSLKEGNLLHEVLCPDGLALLIPDVVAGELRTKAAEDPRFGPASRVFEGMKREGKFTEIASPFDNDELLDVMQTISPRPLSELRRHRAKDIGEIVAISHAVLLARKGHEVELLLEDRDGVAWAKRAGFQTTITSMRVLGRAARAGLRTQVEMRALYTRMQKLDRRFARWQETPLARADLYRVQV